MSREEPLQTPEKWATGSGMDRLRSVLRGPITDNDRTRRYQRGIDRSVGCALEQVREHAAQGVPAHAPYYCAFCYQSPLSRWQGNSEILDACAQSLDRWADAALADDLPDLRSWDHTWTFEGIAHSTVWLEDSLPQKLREKLHDAFIKAGAIFTTRERMGTVGNQCMSGILGDFLYGCLLNNEDYLALSWQRFSEYAPKVIMENGQVNEQYGPCPNYSSGAFYFTFQYFLLAGVEEFEERIIRALQWFREMHTESLYLFPGPSSRKYYGRWMVHLPLHCFPGLEFGAQGQPMFHTFRDRYEELAGERSREHISAIDTMSILLNRGEDTAPTPEQADDWNRPRLDFYEPCWFGRGPIKYALIRRQYQTAICFSGWLPLIGLQTWAWGDEPPIIHPLHGAPSTTQAWALDTAAHPADRLSYYEGAGCLAADVVWRDDGSSQQGLPDEPPFVVWRHRTMRQLAIFTDVSTVLIHTGFRENRVTRWALNPLEPAEPIFDADGIVRFEDRVGRMISLAGEPEVTKAQGTFPEIREERTVRMLTYEIDGSDTAFAFSNDSFEFRKNDLGRTGLLEFRDETGLYRADVSDLADERGQLHHQIEGAKIKRIGQ